jgi:hypothetical protein
MALNFDVSNITDYQTITTSPFDESKWHPVTHYLVFALMGVGINEIKAGNVAEVFRRVALHQKLHGPALEYHHSPEKIYITYQDIKNHIGLHTNVSNMTAAEFNKMTLGIFERHAVDLCTNPITAYGQVAVIANRKTKVSDQAA